VLLNEINHLAVISKDIDKLRDFYTEVFEAEVGPTKQHGDKGDETMTVIRIGPHAKLNVVTIEGNSEPDRQTPMRVRGRLDHFGLQAAFVESFEIIRQRLMEHGAPCSPTSTSSRSPATSPWPWSCSPPPRPSRCDGYPVGDRHRPAPNPSRRRGQ
jgi:catechol 2,3-dioxygenase-like lactoylglutathione lyase family enzyme